MDSSGSEDEGDSIELRGLFVGRKAAAREDAGLASQSDDSDESERSKRSRSRSTKKRKRASSTRRLAAPCRQEDPDADQFGITPARYEREKKAGFGPIQGSYHFFQNMLAPDAEEIARTTPSEPGKPLKPIQVLDDIYMDGLILANPPGHGKTRAALTLARRFLTEPLSPEENANHPLQAQYKHNPDVQFRTKPKPRSLLCVVPVCVLEKWKDEASAVFPELQNDLVLYHGTEANTPVGDLAMYASTTSVALDQAPPKPTSLFNASSSGHGLMDVQQGSTLLSAASIPDAAPKEKMTVKQKLKHAALVASQRAQENLERLQQRAAKAAAIIVTVETLVKERHLSFFQSLYDVLPASEQERQEQRPKRAILIDEIHFVRNLWRSKGRRKNRAYTLANLCQRFHLPVAISGTLISNTYHDLYSILYVIGLPPGNQASFWEKNAKDIEYLFKHCIGKYVVRQRGNLPEMPPLIKQIVKLSPTELQKYSEASIVYELTKSAARTERNRENRKRKRELTGQQGDEEGSDTEPPSKKPKNMLSLTNSLLNTQASAVLHYESAKALLKPVEQDVPDPELVVKKRAKPSTTERFLAATEAEATPPSIGGIRVRSTPESFLEKLHDFANQVTHEQIDALEQDVSMTGQPSAFWRDLGAIDSKSKGRAVLPTVNVAVPLRLTRNNKKYTFEPPSDALALAASAKLQWLVKLIVCAMERNEKVLVFSRSVKFIRQATVVMSSVLKKWHALRLEQRAKQDPAGMGGLDPGDAPPHVVMYIGEMDQMTEGDVLRHFQESDCATCPVMFASQAAQVGIDIREASIVVTDNIDFGPQNDLQQVHRAHRMLNIKPVRWIECWLEMDYADYVDRRRNWKLAQNEGYVGGQLPPEDKGVDYLDGNTLRKLLAKGETEKLPNLAKPRGRNPTAEPKKYKSAKVFDSNEARDAWLAEEKKRLGKWTKKLKKKCAQLPNTIEIPAVAFCKNPPVDYLGLRLCLTEDQIKEHPIQTPEITASMEAFPVDPTSGAWLALDAAHAHVKEGKLVHENGNDQELGVETIEGRRIRKMVECVNEKTRKWTDKLGSFWYNQQRLQQQLREEQEEEEEKKKAAQAEEEEAKAV